MIRELADDTFDDILQEPIVLVYFWAEWSAPSRLMQGILDPLAAEMSDLIFASLDVDENYESARNHNVTSVPTLILFKNGHEAGRSVGSLPESLVSRFIKKSL